MPPGEPPDPCMEPRVWEEHEGPLASWVQASLAVSPGKGACSDAASEGSESLLLTKFYILSENKTY